MTKAKTIITRLPFAGFYESHYSGEIDQQESQFVEYEVSDRQAENGIPADLRLNETELYELLFRHTQYRVAYRMVAEWYVQGFNAVMKSEHDLDLRLTFESMDSPREYNFTTDRIYAHIPVSVVRKLWAISKAESHVRLKARIAESFTSRDGFHSYYANGLRDEWLNPVTEYDHNQLCTLIEAVTDFEQLDRDDLHFYYATFGDDGGYQAWESAVDWPAFEAACEELRQEKLDELQDEMPDYVLPYRCPETADLFSGRSL